MEWEFMCRMVAGKAGEDVIGKEVGSSPGISHSPPFAPSLNTFSHVF